MSKFPFSPFCKSLTFKFPLFMQLWHVQNKVFGISMLWIQNHITCGPLFNNIAGFQRSIVSLTIICLPIMRNNKSSSLLIRTSSAIQNCENNSVNHRGRLNLRIRTVRFYHEKCELLHPCIWPPESSKILVKSASYF